MRRILVTAISGDIANGILKILKSKEEILYGCDVNDVAVGMDLVSVFWKSKYAVEDGYVEQVIQKCIQYDIKYVIPVNEREIEVIGKRREEFETLKIKLLIQKQEILNIFLDKYNTYEKLCKIGIKVPATYTEKQMILDVSKKYICKPRKSNGSKDIFMYDFSDRKLQKTSDYVIQEYIEGDKEYTVGVFRQGRRINTIAFRRKLKNGYSNQVELVNIEAINHIAEKIAVAFDVEGYINIQMREYMGQFYIFEVNPRISGTVRFRHMLGFSDVLWWLKLLDGEKIESYKVPYKKAIGVRELNEKFLILE